MGLACSSWRSLCGSCAVAPKKVILRKEGLRIIDGDKPGEGDAVRLKRGGEVGRIVLVFSVHPFKGDVVVHWWERRELCSIEEVEKVET